MNSAFGVDHGGISKSFSGGAFKPISAMSRAERSGIAGSYKQAKGMSDAHRAFKDLYHSNIVPAVKENQANGLGLTRKGKLKRDMFATSAATLRTGGKNTGQSHIFGAAPSKKTGKYLLSHEQQHAIPRRSAYRLHGQILSDPQKMLREEGRADYMAGGHYNKHKDAGSVYAQGARAINGLDRKGPNKQFKFQPETKRAFKDAGIDTPRVTNRQGTDGVKAKLHEMLPHYNMNGPHGDDALRSYRDMHDTLKAKGVRQGRNRG